MILNKYKKQLYSTLFY